MYPSQPPATELQKLLPWSWLISSISSEVAQWWIGGAMMRSEDEHEHRFEFEVDKRERKAGSLMLEKGNVVKT